MTTNQNPLPKAIPTRFARETRFNVPTVHRPFARQEKEDPLVRLKAKLLTQLREKNLHVHTDAYLIRAAREAEALAWEAGYPLLLLPVLMEEKAVLARKQAQRQSEIRARSESFLVEAA